jgi:hypothetical protein
LFSDCYCCPEGDENAFKFKNRNYECYGYLAGITPGGSVASFFIVKIVSLLCEKQDSSKTAEPDVKIE